MWGNFLKMKLEASRFGNHAVHQIRIPEAEFTFNMYNGFVPVLAAQCGVMLQPMLYIRI
ncbi:hypothetical protein DAPPUDRAFT_232221 [Daphnia pulex]|uniref:Uncharacterized protein n=1 Tax=Daphnia pulex TaxID=6669 RepID=E9FS52_DAPPU|nr:hypothetical protein DAPPUDRAFT_232221 [Daphnia pulex]|eukprot:EFX90377.1 hypothetical protein DAPPUDRAFT_232221 [Daphnia pulex]